MANVIKERERNLKAAAKRSQQFDLIEKYKRECYKPKKFIDSIKEGTCFYHIKEDLKRFGIKIYDTRDYRPKRLFKPSTNNAVLNQHYKSNVTLLKLSNAQSDLSVRTELDKIFKRANNMQVNSYLILSEIINKCKFQNIKSLDDYNGLNNDKLLKLTVLKFHSTFYYEKGCLKFFTQFIFYNKKEQTYIYYSVLTENADPLKHNHEILNELAKRVNTIDPVQRGMVKFNSSLNRYLHVYVYHYVRWFLSNETGKKMDTGTDIYRVLHYDQFKHKIFNGSPDVMKTITLISIFLFYYEIRCFEKSFNSDDWTEAIYNIGEINDYVSRVIFKTEFLYGDDTIMNIRSFNEIYDDILNERERGYNEETKMK